MKTLHQWPNSFTIETAKMNLIEGAKDWFILRIREFTNCMQFREIFWNYVVEESKSEKWKRIKNCIQDRSVKLITYFYAKIKLCVQLQLSLKETKQQVWIGLWSKDSCMVMSSRNHTSIN